MQRALENRKWLFWKYTVKYLHSRCSPRDTLDVSLIPFLAVQLNHSWFVVRMIKQSLRVHRSHSSVELVAIPRQISYGAGQPLVEICLWVRNAIDTYRVRKLSICFLFLADRVHILEDRSLVLENVNINDEGEYSCEADNVVGSASAVGSLVIHCTYFVKIISFWWNKKSKINIRFHSNAQVCHSTNGSNSRFQRRRVIRMSSIWIPSPDPLLVAGRESFDCIARHDVWEFQRHFICRRTFSVDIDASATLRQWFGHHLQCSKRSGSDNGTSEAINKFTRWSSAASK